MAYGAGLRVSEVAHLKVDDFDSKLMLIWVEQGKGGKDRNAVLSPQLLELLRMTYPNINIDIADDKSTKLHICKSDV